MSSWQKLSLFLATITSVFLFGIGVAIAEESLYGAILCILGSILTPGIGFSIKKRLNI